MLLIPQRYEFSSKSQLDITDMGANEGCCWYHKGTNFQANHNAALITLMLVLLLLIPQRYEFSSKSQLPRIYQSNGIGCCWYHKGTNFQANHNLELQILYLLWVVADTTKVRIFKQITTMTKVLLTIILLLLIPQRYEFSSKSQPRNAQGQSNNSCCWYHKGTNFQANHNSIMVGGMTKFVVADTTKVRIFKQITTEPSAVLYPLSLLLIPQRYEFSSKSQQSSIRQA